MAWLLMGVTVCQIAVCLGISASNLYAKQGHYTELLEAIKKSRAEGIHKVSNALFEKPTQGNVTAMIYYLKVRDRENWGENQIEPFRQIPAVQINVGNECLLIDIECFADYGRIASLRSQCR